MSIGFKWLWPQRKPSPKAIRLVRNSDGDWFARCNQMYIVQLRRDTEANWLSVDPVLAAGEPAYETISKRLKVGDGVSRWSTIPYQQLDDVLPRPPAQLGDSS